MLVDLRKVVIRWRTLKTGTVGIVEGGEPIGTLHRLVAATAELQPDERLVVGWPFAHLFHIDVRRNRVLE